jgi:hypothetical protein
MAQRRASKGTVQLGLEIPEDLDRRLRERCQRLSLKLTDEVRLALRRHLDYPPPDDASPPLPDVTPQKTTAKKRKGK